ncbi:MAG TPA: pitrilysin family protein [Candidatus Deferrimicrobiaceae bacterium]
MSIRALSLALAFYAAFAAVAGGATPPDGGSPLVEKYQLPNGLTVVIRPNPSSPVVAVQAWVKSGSTTEPAARAGMSHILEHMAFKGTTRRGPGEIAREVESAGGEVNAYTSFDQTVYHITISGRYLEIALDILADTLGNSVFDSAELARELEVVLEEVRMNEDNPGRVASKALFREAYTVHPYGRPVIGFADTIRSTTRDDLVSYFRTYYVPGNMVLVIAGDVDPGAARPLIERTFGQLPRQPVSEEKMPAEPPQKEIRVVLKEKDARRVYLEMGFHGPSMRDPDVYAWDLLSMILGSGDTSRLVHVVKDQKGLVDSVYASSYTPRDPGMLFVGGTIAPEKARAALKEILLETFRLAAAPPEGPELARAKTATETDFLYSLESQSALARHVGFYETTLNDAAFERVYLQKIRAVTAADILAVAGKYLVPGNLTVAAVLPAGQGALLPVEEIRMIAGEAYGEATASPAKPERGARVVKEVLPNGIRVIVRENPAVPVVAVGAGFLAGTRGEPKEKGGVSGLTAGMLTKGTTRHTAREISEAVENMGASLGGYSGRNSFGLQGKFLRRDFGPGFRLFAESLREPTFPAEELEKKRRETLGALTQQKDQLTQTTILLFLAAHYGEHPYGRNPIGTENSVRAMTPEDLKRYYERWADPRNMVIAVSGDIGAEVALAAVRKAFSDFPERPGYEPLGALPVPAPAGIRRAEEQREKQQAHFVIGYPGARFTDPDRYSLDVLGSALAGMGGRLFVNLRDRKSLAYSVTSFSSEQVDPGFFAFYMGTSADKLDGAVADTLKEIGEVKADGVTQEELDRAKKWMIGSYEIGLQSNSSYVDKMVYNELYGVGYEETFRAPEKIAAVTLSDVNRVAGSVLDTEEYTIAILRGK